MSAPVVRPERAADGGAYPVQHDVGEQLIPGEAALYVTAAIAPGAEFFENPRRETHGRVGQTVSERLRFGALDSGVAGLLAQPVVEFAAIGGIVNRRIRGFAPQRQQVDVDASYARRFSQGHGGADERAPIAALSDKALVPEDIAHQLDERLAYVCKAQSCLAGLERQRVARQRRRNDGKRIVGVTAEARWVREHRDDLVEFPDGARPAV